ncbi:MAG: hypothetical protein U9R01_02055, partial [candidate division WOR-3 bacterium]|nr:hypothetical protein [candidate division WOR-3 bacterium]
NRGNISKSMKEVGYEENTCKNPSNLTESKGFKQICKEIGLTDDFITQCLVDDIADKPRNRQPELALAAKMLGLLTDKIDLKSNLKISFDEAFKPKQGPKRQSKQQK